MRRFLFVAHRFVAVPRRDEIVIAMAATGHGMTSVSTALSNMAESLPYRRI
jgi:hypothetical protein